MAGVTQIVVGPGAVGDLREIREHYESVQAGLSRRFAVALDELFARMEQFPRSAPVVVGYADVRRAMVRGFPYLVFYRHQSGRIDVLRLLHAARSDADRPPAL